MGAFAGPGTGFAMASEARVSPWGATEGGEPPSSISQFCRQLEALSRKNFLSKRRSKLQLVSERWQSVCWLVPPHELVCLCVPLRGSVRLNKLCCCAEYAAAPDSDFRPFEIWICDALTDGPALSEWRL